MFDGLVSLTHDLIEALKSQASAASRVLLVLVIVGSVLALGSIHIPVLLIVSGLASCSAILALRRSSIFRPRAPLPLLMILGLTAVTLLQVIPLPWSWLERLAPANAEVWGGALAPLGRPAPAYAPLSLDPVATWGEVLRGWTYAAVFIAAMAAGARRGAAWGALIIFGSAAVLAFATLAHGLLDVSRVFGIYSVRSGGSGFGIAPLINNNNRAGYLNLGILAGASLLALNRPPIPRWIIALGLAPTIGATLLTGSRGGVGCLVVGSLLLFGLLRQSAREVAQPEIWKRLLFVGGAVAAVGVGFTLLAKGSATTQLLLDRDTSKLRLLATTVPLIREFPWFGIGRGAFESAFPAFRTAGDNTIFSHPENFVAQWAAEWGVLVTLATLALTASLLRPKLWRIPNNVAACGLFAGAAALCVQNLVDLSSEVPGVVIGGVAAAGFAWGGATEDLGKSRTPWKSMLAAAALGLSAMIGVVAFGRETLLRDRDLLRSELGARRPWPELKAELAAAMSRHPAEPYFPRLGAIAAWRTKQESPMPWIARALERGMSEGRTHYLLAQYLAANGKHHQALLELRLAAEYDPQLATQVGRLAARIARNREQLTRAVPDGAAGARVLLILAYSVGGKQPELSLDFLRESVARDPKMPEARLLLVKKLLAKLEADATPSPERDNDAREMARLLDGVQPTSNEARQYRARMLVATGQGSQALANLARECPQVDPPLPCIAIWLSIARVVKDRAALDGARRALASAACTDSRQCADAYWNAGEASRAFGDTDTALRDFERSATESNTAAAWQNVAKFATQLGRTEHALRALSRAQLLSPGDHNLAASHDAAHQKLLNQLQLEQLKE